MARSGTLEILKAIVQRPGYRRYLWHTAYARFGYDSEQWAQVTYSREWREFLATLPLKSLAALEISPGPRPVVDKESVGSYRAVQFPEFDIAKDALPETFDIIIAEQVFEHLRHPYKAARNVYKMLRDDGVFLIATPFLVRVHDFPGDYTRWTPDELEAFLEDCGFTSEVHAWGNRKAVKANFTRWAEYGWKRDLRNETEFPVHVWAYARKRGHDNE